MSELQVKVLRIVGGCVVFVALAAGTFLGGRAIALDEREARNSPPEPTATSPLDVVWSGMDSSERFDFCTEARAAGYEVFVNEVVAEVGYDAREVRYWLEDRCG